MNCPACENTDLLMTERQGIEIDYCPRCRGVWLDRGELDKIIERSSDASPGQRRGEQTLRHSGHEHGRHDYHDSHHEGRHKKKREGFLSELFDFD